jgi:hypothetical protein
MPRSRCRALALALALGTASPAGAEQPCLFTEYTIEEMATILRGEGYGSVQVLEDQRISFKAEGSTYLLLLYDDGDLQLFYGLSGATISSGEINEWNRTRRLARAYVDTDLMPVLESDLPSPAGLSAPMVTGFVKTFVQTLAPSFRAFVTQRNRRR